jgi:DNA-directed RNA polymerase specialized sigma24 family protein
MTGKEYMERIRNVRREIRLLQEQILRDTVYASNVKAIRYDVDRVQTSPEGDRMADIISGIVGNEDKLYKKVKDLMKQEDDARKYLLQLREEQERVLVLHYFNDLKWDDVAEQTGYSLSRVYEIKNEGLNKLTDVLKSP